MPAQAAVTCITFMPFLRPPEQEVVEPGELSECICPLTPVTRAAEWPQQY